MEGAIIREHDQLPQWHGLFRAAIAARRHAYAPYSKLLVGAAVSAGSGRYFGGANYESASFGLSICAERAAILAAQGVDAVPLLDALAIAAEDPTGGFVRPGDWIAPCGACRQWIFEASKRVGRNIIVMCGTPDFSRVWVTSARELLPGGFG